MKNIKNQTHKENFNSAILNFKIDHVNLSKEYSNEILYSEYPKSKHNEFYQNELNSFGYRCDEFVKEHNKHIVFSGCSVTWGAGLNIDETWSKILYDKINYNKNYSGYFNLSIPGSSLIDQICTLFKYFKTYGNPNKIFICVPDILRFYFYNNKNNYIYDSFYNEDHIGFIKLFLFQYYFMLEQYCNSNNIDLYSFTYDYNKINFNNLFENKFKSFIDIKKENLIKFVSNNNDNDFAILARDEDHYGTAFHKYWSNFLYDVCKDSL